MMTIETQTTLSGHYLLHASVPLRVEHFANSGLAACPYFGPTLHLILLVCKDGEPYELELSVRDYSYYQECKRYKCSREDYRRKTHELINWMRDQDLRLVTFKDVCTLRFFPEV